MDVVTCSTWSGTHWKTRETEWARGTDLTDLGQEEALLAAEDLALEMGGYGAKSLTGRKSAWRREPASQAQLSKAIGLRLRAKLEITGQRGELLKNGETFSSPFSKGEVSEAIDLAEASKRIDPLVRLVTAR
jgi:hypothetical protein